MREASRPPPRGRVLSSHPTFTPPSTQPSLPCWGGGGCLFEETGKVSQVLYENRKWLTGGCYHVREGLCVLSPVSGQQRRPWDDRTNGSSWASCKSRGLRGSSPPALVPPRSTAKTEHPEPGAENPGPSDTAQFCGGGSSRQPLAHALELPRRAPLEANPGAHGPC